jgi:hypothetical protein
VTTRASVLAALAGLGALVTITINLRNSNTQLHNANTALRNAEVAAQTLATTQDTFQNTQRGHLTGRYTAAIEQLGDKDSIAIRPRRHLRAATTRRRHQPGQRPGHRRRGPLRVRATQLGR